ncbi:MAG TPA: ATP-binding protein [Terriglobales bacterium]|nr:ATP-binding protein [Terriglobales bacterium]
MRSAAKTASAGEEQKLAETLSSLYKTVLERISAHASLFEVLECLCKFMEKHFPELTCSVLLLEADGVTLRHGAAPSLPPEYNTRVDGIQAGPAAGSCGTAVHRRTQVIVRDIATDPLWSSFAQLALPYGLKACWSTPITSREEKVLGTFAVYYRETRDPDPRHLHLVQCATHLAGVAIERHQADQQLRAAETRYRALVENLPAITYIAEVGVLGRWLYVSPQIQSILGFSPEEWLADASNWINHVHADDRERALEAETRFWEIGGIYRADYRMIARDGRVIWLRDDAVYLKTPDAQKPVMQGVLHDITDYKQLEDQLRQSQKMEAVGQLAGGVAHDFNNLLMIIQGRTERIMERALEGDATHKDAREIKEASERATALTRQLLAFSRKQVLQPKLLDMNQVVAEVGRMLQRLIGENIEVELHTAASLWPVKVDRVQMEQAVLNLALNARDAMPSGGKLTIATRNVAMDEVQAKEQGSIRSGNYVALEVRDTGTGMDAETQGHIFEPFFSTKELGKGTGLGLASVYGLVKQSGGCISFQSKLGHGTTFIIYLPESAGEMPTKPQAALPTVRTQGSETILVVEDEDQIRDMVCQYLQQNGYSVLHAQNGKDALEIAQRYRGSIHLLLTDVVMPEMSGHELARDLRRVRPRCKILLTSGYPEHAAVSERASNQSAETLQKPYALNQLARKIRELLETSDAFTAQSSNSPKLQQPSQ